MAYLVKCRFVKYLERRVSSFFCRNGKKNDEILAPRLRFFEGCFIQIFPKNWCLFLLCAKIHIGHILICLT